MSEKYDISVLVVEDDKILGQVYDKLLQGMVYNHSVAKTGEEAIDLFKQYKYDMIISDIMLPGIDGIEFVKRIRKLDKNIQIVFASALNQTDILSKAISLGAAQYLLKPITKKNLLDVIEHVYPNISIRRELVIARLELESANESLNLRVNERTEELQISNKLLMQEIEERKSIEHNLIIAKEAAEAANKTKDAFLANVSHELRTPLNGITGILYLLEKTNLTLKQKEHVKYLQQSSAVLLSIINDILDYAKIASGKMSLEITGFSLRELLDEALPVFRIMSNEKNLEFIYSFDNRIPSILSGDRIRINQIINNIVGNAVKFTEKGKISVSVELKKIENQEAVVNISVKDTGIGISAKMKDEIFSPFIQADGSFTRKYGGTGLGLSISKEFVELHNGKIWFESTEKSGTEFFVEIPFSIDSIKTESCETFRKSISADDLLRFYDSNRVKVLIIEDNKINSEVIQEFLEGHNCRVSLATNGLEGLDRYIEDKPDIILTDIQMPGMDGIEFASQVIKYEKELGAAHTPVIAITAHARNEDKDNVLSSGMDDFLTKPIDFEFLLEIIYKYTNKEEKVKKSLNNDDNIADISFLSKAVFGKKESILKYIKSILELVPEEIEKMKKLTNENKLTEVKNIAHRTKSGVANFKAVNLYSAFDKFKEITPTTESKAMDKYFQNLESRFTEFRNKLEQIKKELEE